MRYLLLFLFYGCLSFAQQVKLQGVTSMMNSKYKTGKTEYVKNVYITSAFSKPGTSDTQGKFSMEFVGLPIGTKIKLQADKDGLEIVNSEALQRVILGTIEPVDIYFAPKGELVENQLMLYKVSKKAIYAKRDELIRKLRANEKESKEALTTIKTDFGQLMTDRLEAEKYLNERIATLEKSLPEFSIRLANENLDTANALFIKAYQAFIKGDIRMVIAILDENILDNLLEQALDSKTQSKRYRQASIALDSKGDMQFMQLLQNLRLKANSYFMDFKFAEEVKVYKKVIQISDSLDVPEADRIAIYNDIGLAYFNSGNYNESLVYFTKVHDIQLADPETPYNEMVLSYENVAQCQLIMGRYKTAMETQLKAIKIAETNDNLGLTARLYDAIAEMYRNLNEPQVALEYQLKCIGIREKIYPANDLVLGTSYNNIAITYGELNMIDKAMENFQKALLINETSDDEMKKASTFGNIAQIYEAQSYYQKAIECHLKAIEIWERKFGTTHPETARAYYNISFTYGLMKETDTAIAFALKSVAPFEAAFDSMHPRLADIYGQLANLYMAKQDYAHAMPYQLKSIKIRESVMEPNLILAKEYHNTAVVCMQAGDFAAAIPFHLKSISIREKSEPTNDLAQGCGNLSFCYQKEGQQSLYLAYQLKHIELLEKLYGSDHPDIITSYHTYAQNAEAAGNRLSALKYRLKALEMLKAKRDFGNTDYALYNREIAKMYYESRELDLAVQYQTEALNAYQKLLDKENVLVDETENELLNYYFGRADVAIINKSYEKALADLKFVDEYVDVSEVKYRMGICHYQLKRYDKALDCYNKALALDPSSQMAFYPRVLTLYTETKQLVDFEKEASAFEAKFPEDINPYMYWCVFYCLKRDYPMAIVNLNKAIDRGLSGTDWIEDPVFENFRNQNQVKIILENMKDK